MKRLHIKLKIMIGTLILGNATFHNINPNSREEIYSHISIHEIAAILSVSNKDYKKLISHSVTDIFDAYVTLWSVECPIDIECQIPTKITLKEIKVFLQIFCTKVRANDNTELMMDNHKCVNWLGREYYVPDGGSSLLGHNGIINTFLTENFHV